MPVIKDTNLDAAEAALSTAYGELLDLAWSRMPNYKRVGLNQPERPIVHIMPKGRRVEYGWYRPGTWTKHSAVVGKDLGITTGKASYDEVFIAGEALNWRPLDLTKLLMHQVIHQISGVPSTATYHNDLYDNRAELVGVTLTRHPTQGWAIWDGERPDLLGQLHDIANRIDPQAFNVTRIEETGKAGSGKMRKWVCGCPRPLSLYTGGIVRAICQRCGQEFRYAHADQDDPSVVARIHAGGAHSTHCER